MSGRPQSLVDADTIVATWRTETPAQSNAGDSAVELLDALTPVLEQPAAELRAFLLQADPRALGAVAALRPLVPAILQQMIDLLRHIAGQGDSEATLKRIPLLETLARAVGDQAALGEAEYLRGYMFRRLGMNVRAIEAYKRALGFGGDAAFRSRTLDRLGNLQTAMSEFDDAAASYAAALKIERDPNDQATILRNIANAMRGLGDFAEANEAERKAALVSETAAHDGYALDAAAQRFSEIGDHAWALKLNQQARAWFEKQRPIALSVNAEIRIGLLHRAGRAPEVVEQFRLTVALFETQAKAMINPAHYIEGWKRSLANRLPLDSPVKIAYALATTSGSSATLEQAIAGARQAGDIALLLRALALRAGWLFDAGQLEQASSELESVQAEASKRGLALPEISALVTMSSISQSGGEVKRKPLEALCRARHLRDVMAGYLATLKLDPAARMIELNDTGAIENQLGQFATEMEVWPEAADYFDQALKLAEVVGDRFKLTNRLAGLRLAASRAGQADRAEAAAVRLRALLVTKDLPDPALVVGGRSLEDYDRATDPTAARHWIEVAAQAGERIRAATQPQRREGVDRQWNDIYWTLAQERREQGLTAEAFAAVQLGKFRGIAEAVAGRAGLTEVPASLAAIQGCLGGDDALLDIALERHGMAIYVVRRDGITAISIPGDATPLLQPDGGDMRDRAASLLRLAQENPLLASVAARTEALLTVAGRLWIAPDPRLGNLPLHAIPIGNRPWCEVRRIGFLPAATALLAPRLRRGGRVLVMGDSRSDLPAARAECATVASLYSAQPRVGPDCSADALRDALAAGTLDVLHIATHGRGNPRHGGLASLLLTDASGQPLWTDLTQINGAAWDVGLVVLSGCSTGLIGRRNSTQFVSVAETVLRAGARAVVACLWPIGDAAAQSAMETFHRTFSAAAQPDVGAALDAARATLRGPDAAVGPVRDGRGRPPSGAMPLEQALNWSAFTSLGVAQPFI